MRYKDDYVEATIYDADLRFTYVRGPRLSELREAAMIAGDPDGFEKYMESEEYWWDDLADGTAAVNADTSFRDDENDSAERKRGYAVYRLSNRIAEMVIEDRKAALRAWQNA